MRTAMVRHPGKGHLYNRQRGGRSSPAAAEGATPVIAQARYHHVQNSGETGFRCIGRTGAEGARSAMRFETLRQMDRGAWDAIPAVIPAQAGIQCRSPQRHWIPAFAGMTSM